jgi:outer membrane murein-binding lipoprotein Lpp
LQQIRQSGDDILPSVLREKLTAKDVIKLTNNARAVNGLHPLAENQLLNLIAESRANDMLEKQYFAHVSPTGQQASDIAQTIGYHYKIIAENIGSGDFYTNQKIVDGWMQSPGHRANILSTEVQEIGAAVIRGKMKNADTYVTVQIFGLQSLPVAQKTCVAPSSNLLNDIEAKKAEIASLQDQLNSLKQELDNEQEAIETDKKYTYDNAEKIQKLNERINAFNEKSRWYNKIVGEVKAKSDVAQSMVNEYNRMSQIYNDCRSSHDIHD